MRAYILIPLLLILSACSSETPTPVVSPGDPAPDMGWELHGNDTGEQRFSTLDLINRGNVDALGLAWFFDIKTPRGVEATPLVVDGVMYVSGSWSVVYALNATNGELLWEYDPRVDRAWLAKTCCDAVNRGVAYDNGKVFVGTIDGRLVALNADSGAVAWEVITIDQNKPYSITGAPRIVGDKVVIGNGGAELGVRGYVSAYAAADGALVWRFYTVPGNPEDGFENATMEMAAKTWTGQWWEWGGGGTVWDSMVFDAELDLLYIGVGNGSPWNHTMRSPQGGDNLFLTSIVALRPDTGEYVWHYQTTPGETWDFTATQHIILADLEIAGEQRQVLMQAPKNGFFYVLDRRTGELISAQPYTEVNWASHIDLKTGRPVETENARLFDGKNVSLPSNAGGHNWNPMSYNPQTGLVYIPTMQLPSTFLQPTEAKDSLPGQGYWNVGFDRVAMAPPMGVDVADAIDSTVRGQLVAWDPVRQEPRWASELGRAGIGGILSTGGGLVFAGENGAKGEPGVIVARDAKTGEILWSHGVQTVAHAPPVTYSIDGEQYVAIAVGLGGGAVAEGGIIVHHWGVQTIPRVMVFKLNGRQQLPALPEIDRRWKKPPAVTGDKQQIARGQAMYERHCTYCHGAGLNTGGITPDLRRSGAAIHEVWQQIVIDGVLASAGMVSFRDFISPEDAEAIRQYVLLDANRVYAAQEAQKAGSD